MISPRRRSTNEPDIDKIADANIRVPKLYKILNMPQTIFKLHLHENKVTLIELTQNLPIPPITLSFPSHFTSKSSIFSSSSLFPLPFLTIFFFILSFPVTTASWEKFLFSSNEWLSSWSFSIVKTINCFNVGEFSCSYALSFVLKS